MNAVVVGVDRSAASASALAWAAEEASLRDCDLIVLHAYLPPLAYAGTDDALLADLEPRLHAEADAVIDDALRQVRVPQGVAVRRELHPGIASHALVEAAEKAELLVVGSRGAGGFEGLHLGATAEHCARHVTRPIVVVPPGQRRGLGKVVVGVDGSAPGERALAWAADEAKRRGLAVEVVIGYQPYRERGPFGADFMDVASPGWRVRLRHVAEKRLDAALATVPIPGGVTVAKRVVAGHPAAELAAAAVDAELLVVGSRGLGGFRGVLLGSVSRQLLHHAPCPVAVIR